MANDGSMDSRHRHSEIGRKYVYDKMANNESALMDYMDSQLIGLLGDIIYAHSDIKSEDGMTEKNTFCEVFADHSSNRYRSSERLAVTLGSCVSHSSLASLIYIEIFRKALMGADQRDRYSGYRDAHGRCS